MKKRIVCVLLTLIMLVSLVPATALTASAASRTTSESAITVLKQLEGYSKSCQKDGSQYFIGYGTVCEEKHVGDEDGQHTIMEESVADEALRAEVAKMDTAVNKFASSNGLNLSQSKHDALVLFSYNCGTAWMSGTGVFKSAVTSGATGNEFLNAICLWNNSGDKTDLTKRRMVEANMYLNGVYSNVAPSNYTYVTFDANEGTMTEGDGYRQYYDTTISTTPEPVPTYKNHIFMGWYVVSGTSCKWVPYLTADHKKATLVAQWQAKGETDTTSHAVSYKLTPSQLVSKTVYKTVGGKEWAEETKEYKDAKSLTIDRDFIDAKGVRWARIKGSGWVKVGTPEASTSDSSIAAIDVTVNVTNSYVNRREKASIYSALTGKYNMGDQLRIIATENADGFLWGKVAESDTGSNGVGWVALMYTNFSSVSDVDTTITGDAIGTATVVCSNYVNVRSDAGVGNKIVGALANGTKVSLYETKTVNGHQWGRTNSGWFCLTYAKVSLTESAANSISNDPSALAYTFTGKTNTKISAYSEADEDSEVKATLASGTAVTVTQVKQVVVESEEETLNDTWGKTSKGWINLKDVKLDTAKYAVIADTLNVRSNPGTNYDRVDKLANGVELDISKISVNGSEIWGFTVKYDGWVNLASKYVSRTNAPTSTGNTPTGETATIIGADKVNVRGDARISGKLLGTIARGTTVNILDQKNGWYMIDYDIDGSDKIDSWVYKDYVEVKKGTVSSGSAGSTTETGTGIIANTYSGVNVRSNPGTGSALLGKILTGTEVEILEVTNYGSAKWGRVASPMAGWICMDYVAMMSYEDIPGYTDGNAGLPEGSTTTDSFDNCVSSATTAIYTAKASDSVDILKETESGADVVRTLKIGDSITIQELIAVSKTEILNSGTDDNANNTADEASKVTTLTTTTYWARVNDGYIMNPMAHLTLDALAEESYTLTGSDTLNVRNEAGTSGTEVQFKLKKGDIVSVTKLQLVDDRVWGWIENADGKEGWASLYYMSEGAIYLNNNAGTTGNTGSNGTTGTDNSGNDTGFSDTYIGSSTGNTGKTSSNAYLYTGTVKNNSVGYLNVRASTSDSSKVEKKIDCGKSLKIYETTIANNMAWGRTDGGWVYLYYVDLVPYASTAIDARVVYTDATPIYTEAGTGTTIGSYVKMAVIDIYEVVGEWSRTDLGWVWNGNLL